MSNPNFGDFKHSYFSAATYDHLFGPPTPAAVRRMKNKKFYGDDIPSVRKSKKPLPGLLSDNWLFNQSAQGDPGQLLVWRVQCPTLVWSGYHVTDFNLMFRLNVANQTICADLPSLARIYLSRGLSRSPDTFLSLSISNNYFQMRLGSAVQ